MHAGHAHRRALFATAQHAGSVDQVEADLKTVDQALRAVPQLQRAFRAPTVSDTQKRDLLRKAFESRVGPLTLRFLILTVDHGRESVLADIYAEFHRLANEARNILPVEVSAAVPLTDAERDALLARKPAAVMAKTSG